MADAIANQPERVTRVFPLLLVAFVLQIAGRLVDLRWHATHEEFEGGIEQLQAHWLIWLATLFMTAVAIAGVRATSVTSQIRGYALVLIANLAYAVVAVIHFLQHLNELEVDWAHVLLVVTNIAAVLGIIWVIAARVQSEFDFTDVG